MLKKRGSLLSAGKLMSQQYLVLQQSLHNQTADRTHARVLVHQLKCLQLTETATVAGTLDCL